MPEKLTFGDAEHLRRKQDLRDAKTPYDYMIALFGPAKVPGLRCATCEKCIATLSSDPLICRLYAAIKVRFTRWERAWPACAQYVEKKRERVQ